jgi:hypothetical protein
VHVHVESTWLYTSDNLKEDIIHLRQARRGNIKVRRVTYDQENLQPCGISITLSGGFGVLRRARKGIIKIRRIAYL